MAKKVAKQTYKQLLNKPKEQLIKEINSMVSTVNTRLRRLEQAGLKNKSYFLSYKADAILANIGTGSGRVAKASKKMSVEELAQHALGVQKMYNYNLTTKEIKADFKETAKRMKVTEKALEFIYSQASNGIITHLFQELGTDLPKIVHNRQQAGQSNQEIIDDLMKAIERNNNNIDIIADFAGEHSVWLFN